ncbi:MAG: phosphatase PAP2 family protein [Treponema sp.]|nr:phosphatase PAP2 family protein [Treponema sp.]
MDYLYALQCIRESCSPFINLIFVFFSEVVLKAGVIICAIIYWCISKEEGITLIFGYTSSYSLNQFIKNLACVFRPWLRDSRLHVAKEAVKTATGYSFPSGHTVTTASVFGGISMWQRQKKWLVAIMSLLIVMVAFARNWLGAHTISDVLIAIIIAAVMLSLITVCRYLAGKHPESDVYFCFGGIALSVIILLIEVFKPYPLDTDAAGNLLADPYLMKTDCFTACGMLCGALLGWWLERRFVKFSVEGNLKQKILRFMGGLTGFAIIYFGGKFAFGFMGAHLEHLVKYFLLMFYIVYLYPLIIKAVQNKR